MYTSHNEIGFKITIILKNEVNEHYFIDYFLEQIIEPLGLAIGGNPLGKDGAFVTLYDKGNITTKQYIVFKLKMKNAPYIQEYEISDLM